MNSMNQTAMFVMLIGASLNVACSEGGGQSGAEVTAGSDAQDSGIADSALADSALAESDAPVSEAQETETVTGAALAPDKASPQGVGTALVWTATSQLVDPEYRFLIARGAATPVIVRDFGPDRTFAWTPLAEGSYTVQVATRPKGSPESTAPTTDSEVFVVTTRLTGTAPLLTGTAHPLIALFSAPPCAAGTTSKVQFRAQGTTAWSETMAAACDGTSSVNFLLAGLRASTTYEAKSVSAGAESALLTVQTGAVAITGAAGVPTTTVRPVGADTSAQDGLLLYSGIPRNDAGSAYILPFATDLAGNIVWYYDVENAKHGGAVLTSFTSASTMLVMVDDDEHQQGQYLREIDLLGNSVRELGMKRLNYLLAQDGEDETVGAVDHEAVRFPNGDTLIMASVERMMKLDHPPQGIPAHKDVDVLGSMIIALDANWEPKWHWNSFDHLDVERTTAMAYEIYCKDNAAGCPPLFLADEAYDHTHGNAIAYSPADGNLIFSMRHQDWVIKLRYENGAGDPPAILWKLGKDGDFTGVSNQNWFSHQHGANYVSDHEIALFDNGNLRCISVAGVAAGCGSRGQVLALTETGARTATLQLNAELGVFSMALGMAQKLANGNFHFTAGAIMPAGSTIADLIAWLDIILGQSIEVVPEGVAGRLDYTQQVEAGAYRSFRMRSMYELAAPTP